MQPGPSGKCPAPSRPPWLGGVSLPRLPSTSLPGGKGDPAQAPKGEQDPTGRRGLAGGRGCAAFPPPLTPAALATCAPRGGQRGPLEISRGLCIFPAQPISLRNRIKFIDLSTHYLFRQLCCGAEGGGKGRAGPPAPPAPRGASRAPAEARIRRGRRGRRGPRSRDRPRSAARSGKKGGWGAPRAAGVPRGSEPAPPPGLAGIPQP